MIKWHLAKLSNRLKNSSGQLLVSPAVTDSPEVQDLLGPDLDVTELKIIFQPCVSEYEGNAGMRSKARAKKMERSELDASMKLKVGFRLKDGVDEETRAEKVVLFFR